MPANLCIFDLRGGVHQWLGAREFEYEGQRRGCVQAHIATLPKLTLRAVRKDVEQLRELLYPLLRAKYEQHRDLARDLLDVGKDGCVDHPPVADAAGRWRYDPGAAVAATLARIAADIAGAPHCWGVRSTRAEREEAEGVAALAEASRRDAARRSGGVAAALDATGGAQEREEDAVGLREGPSLPSAGGGLPEVPDVMAVADLPDHWARLHVPRDAEGPAIKRAFHKLCALLHPDRPSNRDNPEAPRRFQLVTEAFAVIGDDEARRKYAKFVDRGGVRRTRGSRSRSRSGGRRRR